MSGTSKVHIHKHTIYLVRHGQSATNVSGVNLAPEEDILTDTGKQQADLLGKHLKDVTFTKAISSNYPRAKETANFILKNSSVKDKLDLKIEEKIRERELGDFVGQSAGVVSKEMFAAFDKGILIHKFEIPGAETVAEFDGRIELFVDDLFRELAQSPHSETVLIVSHAITIVRLMSLLRNPAKGLSLPSWNLKSCLLMKNTAYHIFTVEVPALDCTDKNSKIRLNFLHFHQRPHLIEGTDQDPTVEDPEQAGSLLFKLGNLESDSPSADRCVMQ